MRPLWLVATGLLLAACSAGAGPVSCAPCPGPGFVATGLPSAVDHGTLTVCVGGETCRRSRLDGPIPEKSQQLVELADKGTGWEQYDGTPVEVTVTSGGHRWQGTGDLEYLDGGDGVCSCSNLLAEVVLSRLG